MPLGRVDIFSKEQRYPASSQTTNQVINASTILPIIMESNQNSESTRTMSVRDMAKQYEELHCRNRRPDRLQVTSRTREATGFPGRQALHESHYANLGLKRRFPETAGDSTKHRSFLDVSFLHAKTCHPLDGRESDATMSEPPLPREAMVTPSQPDLITEPQSLEVSIDDPAVRNAILQTPVLAMETLELLSSVSAMETMETTEPRSPVSVRESSPEYGQRLEPRLLHNEAENVMESSPEYAEPRLLHNEAENVMESSPECAEPLTSVIAMETSEPLSLVGVMETLEPNSLVGAMETSLVGAMETLEQQSPVIEAPFASEARLENRTSDNGSLAKAMDTQSGLLPIITSENGYLMALAERTSLPSAQLLTSLQPLCDVVPDATSRPEHTFLKRSAKQPKVSKRKTNIFGLAGRGSSKRRRELSIRGSGKSTAKSTKTGDAAACLSAGAEGQCISETSALHFDAVASSTKIAEEQEIIVAIRHPVKKSITKRFRHWLTDKFSALRKKKSRRDQPKPSSGPQNNESAFCGGALDVIVEGHLPSRESAVQQQLNGERRVEDSKSTSMAPASKNNELLMCSATAASEIGEQLACSAATLSEIGEPLTCSAAASSERLEQLACSSVVSSERGEQLPCSLSTAASSESGRELACFAAAPSESGEQLPCSAIQELSGSSGKDGTTSIQGERDDRRNSVTTLLIEPFVRRNISAFIAERGAKLLLSGWKPF